jgi:hypothetical protein
VGKGREGDWLAVIEFLVCDACAYPRAATLHRCSSFAMRSHCILLREIPRAGFVVFPGASIAIGLPACLPASLSAHPNHSPPPPSRALPYPRAGQVFAPNARFLFLPNSTVKFVWDLMVAALVLYTVVAVPLDIGYNYIPFPASFEEFVSVIFWLDFGINLNTAQYDPWMIITTKRW